MTNGYWNALTGGGLIGLAVSVMLLFNGRVTGISGILGGALFQNRNEKLWRISFLTGMIVGGIVLARLRPEWLLNRLESPYGMVALAGLLVGFGTRLGSGCTSGHGVCGISRLSPRSIIATATFMLAGIFTVAFLRILGVLQ